MGPGVRKEKEADLVVSMDYRSGVAEVRSRDGRGSG
jgi:hypothetical protein